MARTGRFGRLPTQAPDLSSQIVSMMEQYQGARDRNILDAWTNKGKFEGKKVTDSDIIKHYRDRRDSYDKDDPEWDEWNNELSQLRFRVSNEKVMMDYRLGKVGPAAVAEHYRKWAKTMPKDSSYYRNMMQSAGQFAKAASSGRSAARKEFDYNALTRKVKSLNGPIDRASQFLEVVNNYARSKGFINDGESVFTLNTFEAADFAGLMAGVERSGDPEWAQFKSAQKQAWPEWSGSLSWAELKKMTNQAIRAKRDQIAEYKKAPADYSSVISGLRSDIEGLKDVKRLKVWTNAMEDYEEAHYEWLEVRQSSEDPSTFLSGDKGYIKDLRKVRQSLYDAGMFAEAGDVWMEIQAVQGKTDAITGTNNEALWQNSNSQTASSATGKTDLEVLADGQATMIEGQRLLLEGKAYKVRVAPDVSDVAQSLGAGIQQSWSIQPFDFDTKTGKPTMPNEGYMAIARRDPETGGLYAEFLIGQPIRDEDGNLLGYRAAADGFNLFKLRDPQDPLSWFFTTEDLFTRENGAQLTQNSNGELILTQDPSFTTAYTDRRQALMDQNPSAVLDRIDGEVGPAPGAGSTPAAREEWQRRYDERQTKLDILDKMEPVGISPSDLPTEGPNNLIQEGGATDVAEMMDEYADVFPINSGNPYIYDKESQAAAIRDFVRSTWDEAVNGPIPEHWKYNEQDAQYRNIDGTVTDKETLSQQQERIAMNAGDDIYDGKGAPYTPGTVPGTTGPSGATPGTSVYGGIASGQEPASTASTTATTGQTAQGEDRSLADLWGEGDDWSKRLTYEWGIIGSDESRSYTSSVLAHAAADPNSDISERDTVQVIAIAALDPVANPYTVEKTAREWDGYMELTGLRGLNRTLVGIDSQGDLDPVMAGAAYGALKAADDRRNPALEQYYDSINRAAPMPLEHPYGTPGYDFAKQDFIHNAQDYQPGEGGFRLEDTVFGRLATNSGTEPAPWPASMQDPKVVEPRAQVEVKPNPSIKLPTVGNISVPPAFGAPEAKSVKAPDAPVAPAAPKPDVSTSDSGVTTPWGAPWGGGYR